MQSYEVPPGYQVPDLTIYSTLQLRAAKPAGPCRLTSCSHRVRKTAFLVTTTWFQSLHPQRMKPPQLRRLYTKWGPRRRGERQGEPRRNAVLPCLADSMARTPWELLGWSNLGRQLSTTEFGSSREDIFCRSIKSIIILHLLSGSILTSRKKKRGQSISLNQG